ncbi:MAG: tetratricopeptide repeat protein [Armatimonadetes bacterium]|nr:tetratricopeptide repeat protein [Armatimonadota bacterium]
MSDQDLGAAKPAARRNSRGVRLWEAAVLAVIVGAASYFAGMRNGVKTEQRRAQRAEGGLSPHGEGMGDMGMGGATGMGGSPSETGGGSVPAMDKAALKERLAGFGHEELLNIGNQHLDQARAAGDAEDPEASGRRFTIAAAAYEQALALKPGDPDVITDLGIALRGLGDYEGAVARFREAAKADPKHPQSRFNLGLVLLHDLNRPADAITAWEDYLTVAPKSDQTRKMVEAELKKLKG